MWKRIAAAVVAALTVLAGLSLFAPAAQAADCNTVPELPGECLSDTTYAYVVKLQGQRDDLVDQAASMRETLGLEQASTAYWQTLSGQLVVQLQAARLDANTAHSDLESAYAEIDRRGVRIADLQHRVTVQRATIKRLRDRLHDLP
jgi:hypothetical protein